MQRDDVLSALMEVAADQAGYVTIGQALRLSVPRVDVVRVAEGEDLRRVRRGVYALRHGHSRYEDEIAVWLHFERDILPWERDLEDPPRSVLSHASAAGMFGLGTIIATLPTVTLPRTQRRTKSTARDLQTHSAPLRREDWQFFDAGGIQLPVTTPSRTIVDLVLDKQEPSYISRAIAEAFQRDLATPESIMDAATHRKSLTASLRARVESLVGSVP